MTPERQSRKVDEEEFTPSEEAILSELKRTEKRKEYNKTSKNTEQRKAYMQKRYAEAKRMRDYIKLNPEKVAALKAQHPDLFPSSE